MRRSFTHLMSLVCFLCLSTALFGQPLYQKPTWFTGFEAEFSYSESNTGTIYDLPIRQVSFNPRLMRMISTRVAVGLSASGVYAEQGSISYYAVGAGPVVTFYPSSIIKQNVPYLELFARYSHYNASSRLTNPSYDRYNTSNNQSGRISNEAPASGGYGDNRFHTGINFGFMRRLSDRLGLVTSAGFAYSNAPSQPPIQNGYPGMILDVGERPYQGEVPQERFSSYIVYLRLGLLMFM